MSDDKLTVDMVHAEVHDLRARAVTAAEKIELGRSQRAVIETANHDAAGFDSGPLREFQGLPIVKSRKENHVRLLASGDNGEDVELEPAEVITPSGPEAVEPESNA